MPIFLLRYLPWLLGAAALFGAGTYTGWHANPWHGRYQTLQTADAIARAQGEAAVRKALEAQLAQAEATSQNNANVMARLNHENAETVADRDAVVTRVRRLEQLLAAAAARPAKGSGVPQAEGGRGTAASSGEAGIDRIGELLVAARGECHRNADRLDALSAEITPQVTP